MDIGTKSLWKLPFIAVLYLFQRLIAHLRGESGPGAGDFD